MIHTDPGTQRTTGPLERPSLHRLDYLQNGSHDATNHDHQDEH
jgi:hypothetical protein